MIKAPTDPVALRRHRFVTEYLRTGHAGKAYRAAGYTAGKHNASSCAWKMLQKPAVQKQLREAAQNALKDLEITEKRIGQEIAAVAFAKPEDEPKVTDKLRALELLAKIHQLFRDAPPAPQWTLDPATLATMSTEDLERALKHAEAVQNLLAGKKPEDT